MFKKEKVFVFMILFIISLLLCLDLFITNARPSSFDGLIHMSNIAQYYTALKDGDFPVRWLGNMANYGMPIALFSQQTVAYLGAFLMFFLHNTLLSYNLIIFLFAFSSSITYYLFLREHVDRWTALFATVLFCFAPYRIINIYIRGAAPEFAASLFLPLILLSLKKWIGDKKNKYYFLLILSLTFLFLTHPISATVFIFIIAAYFFLMLWNRKDKLNVILHMAVAGAISAGISSFYLIPLLKEFKYLYYGLGQTVFLPNSYLELRNIFNPAWFYFHKGDVLTRGHYLHIGEIELTIIIGCFIYGLFRFIFRKKTQLFLISLYMLFFVYVFLITKIGTPFFYLIKPFGNVQHQWRLLSGLLFIPPTIFALTIGKLSKTKKLALGTLIATIVIVLRFPQLYGKNYLQTKESVYFSSKDNLYAQVMNTIWTGPTQDYPVKKVKGEIIEGTGRVTKREEHNSWRRYEIDASTDVRMADYTFYFPGWKAYVDSKETPIEFQDMNYRGVITYRVPAGKHTILVKFTDTKVRLLSNIITLISIGALGLLIIFRKRLFCHPAKKGT